MPIGAIVAVSANNQPRSADLTIAKLADQGIYRTAAGVTVSNNLLATLRHRELAATAKSIGAETGLTYRETRDGESIRGVYRRPLDLVSGRFAMLDGMHSRNSLFYWCARRDCARLRRSASASLRPAAALRASASNFAADGQVVERPRAFGPGSSN